MPIGRLFFEIGGDTSRLNASIKEAIKTAEDAGVKITRAGQSFISKFDEALNPTKKLAEQINLLSAAGRSQADIWKFMSDEINRAAEAAKKNGQAIDPLVKSLQEMNKASLASKISFESIGKAVGDFASHPLESAKSGVSGFLGLLGPTAVGVGAVATGVIAAGVAIYDFAKDAAEAAQQIQNLSYATGMSVEKVQALNRLGQEKGLGDLTSSIEKLNAQLGKGEGGPFTEAILKAGITPKEGADAIYCLEELRKHYAAIPDEAKRAQQATADLGRRRLDLLPIVLNDKESFSEMVAELEHSGAVMKGPQIEALEELHKEIEKHSRAWDSLNHANLAAIYTIDEHEGRPFIVMELLSGSTLRNTIDRPQPISRVLELALQISDGLNAAHANNVIHRDIKPENIAITADGQAKILDFGLAKLDG